MQATVQSASNHLQKDSRSCEAECDKARERQRDPLEALPPELISTVFDFAPTSVLTCTRVSHAWEDYLFNLASPWRKTRLSVEQVSTREKDTLTLNIRAISKTKSGRLARLKFALAHFVHALILDAQQDPVGELLNITNYQDVFLPDPVRRLHLTHLHINTGMDSTNALRVILYICPNLIHLVYEKRYASVQATAWMYSFMRDPPATQLQSLNWCECIEFVSNPALIARYCPHLTSFTTNAQCSFHFDRVNVTGLCQALLKHCPALHTIDLNTITAHDLELSFDTPTVTSHESGSLSTLRLGPGHFMDRHLLESLMERSQETLENASLSEPEDIASVIRRDLPVPFLRLHHACISSINVSNECLASFFQQCTHLKSLKLSLPATEELVTMVAELPALEKLTLDGEYTPVSTLGTLLYILSLQGERCGLKEMTLTLPAHRQDPSDKDWLFSSLGKLGNLVGIIIKGSPPAFLHEDADVNAFLQNAQVSGLTRNLRHLEFHPDCDDSKKRHIRQLLAETFQNLCTMNCS